MNKLWIFVIFGLLLSGIATAADCTYYTTQAKTDGGSDYFGVISTTTNTTAFGTDELYGRYTAFTPRLNFTIPVYDVIVGQAAGGTSDLHWETHLSPATTIILSLASDGTIIDPANYTLVNTTSRRWVINWSNSDFSGTDVNVTFNRTFVKCGPSTSTPICDDLIISPGTIYTGSSTSSWLVLTEPTTYGTSAEFKLNNVSIGNAVTGKNWAVTWDYTLRTCASTQADAGTYAGISNTKNFAYAGFALVAVMILVAISWGIIQVFKGGSSAADLTTLAVLAIGGAVVVIVAYYIIYFIAKALGG